MEEVKDKIRQIDKERVQGRDTERTGKLRVLENIQLVKPREEESGTTRVEMDKRRKVGNDDQQDRKSKGTEEGVWTRVTRMDKRKGKGEGGDQNPHGTHDLHFPPPKGQGKGKEIPKGKLSKTAAVSIKGSDTNFSCRGAQESESPNFPNRIRDYCS